MSQKRPSFQFYPGDWKRNPNLSRCTAAEKGIWIDVLCLFHDQPEYGICRWPLKDIAKSIGCKPSDLKRLIEKGVLKGGDSNEEVPELTYTPMHARTPGPCVTLIPKQKGPLYYSSRMVRDEYVRSSKSKYLTQKNTECGELYGDGKGEPSSSSSSSSTSFSDINTGKIKFSEHGNNELGNRNNRGSQKARDLQQWITD